MGDSRIDVVNALADAIVALPLGHPTRVAIDGRSAAGKTTLADELARVIWARGRGVFRASIDDFHHPGHKHRGRDGGWTPQSYYDQGYDYAAFRTLLLAPLGPGGDRRSRTALFDSLNDVPFPEAWHTVGDRDVAIIDGVFLQRQDLAAHWDFVVWVSIDMETMVERARQRDVEWVGSAEVVEERYRTHWIPTHERYERLTDAENRANAVIDNRDPLEPKIIRLPLA